MLLIDKCDGTFKFLQYKKTTNDTGGERLPKVLNPCVPCPLQAWHPPRYACSLCSVLGTKHSGLEQKKTTLAKQARRCHLGSRLCSW